MNRKFSIHLIRSAYNNAFQTLHNLPKKNYISDILFNNINIYTFHACLVIMVQNLFTAFLILLTFF